LRFVRVKIAERQKPAVFGPFLGMFLIFTFDALGTLA
jgi:hypothetical protein